MSCSTPQTGGLSKLRVGELREKLAEQGLSTEGTKPLLVARLREGLLSNSPSVIATPTKTDNTPVRRSKRTSESFSENLETSVGLGVLKGTSRPGTPLKKMKQETDRPSTPVRRSRRLSGSLDTPALDVPTQPQEKTIIETIEEDTEEPQETADSNENTLEVKSGPETKENVKQKQPESEKDSQEEKKENIPMVKILDQMFTSKSIPRQKPRSGRFWKGERAQFRQIKRDRGQRPNFEQRLKHKDEKMRNKELADFMKNKRNQEKEELRKRIEENNAKKLENERKTEQYQIVKNPAKLKRMKKKQMRMIEKRDILAKK